jgi:CheY-like chemotaxis protein/two-component sensor histidine kinase
MESVGTLAGGIAHDLNNMLSPILLSLGMIRRMNLDETGRTIVDTIEASAKRGADLIKQVLSFARGIEGERTLVQLRHLIDEITKIIKETFPRSIVIDTSVPKDLWPISGDVTQLHQVMMNLCVNARDAMPDGGRIEIAAENVVLDEQYVHAHFETEEGPYVLLSITDTGVGIPASLIDRIFEPFFTTKEVGKGTGLGLSTVMTIVKSHGGAVYVYSEEGKGTTFKIYFPAQMVAHTTRPDEEMKEKYAGNGEWVLVVDDEAAVRNITKTILDAYGYNTLVAVDGEHGLKVFIENKDKIDLVITDTMMPRMDGPSIIRSIRQLNPKTKIIVISGLSQSGKEPVLNEVEFSLTKPFTSEKLLKTVHQALEGDS